MRIFVIGAGSIGSFIGGQLRLDNNDVHFVARPNSKEILSTHGLRLTDCDNGDRTLVPAQLSFGSENDLASADIIIVAVKSRHTEDVAQTIKAHAKPNAIVLSCQNGIRNRDRLRDILGENADIRRVMVPWNVVEKAPGHFHRGSGGHLMMDDGPGELAALFQSAGLACETDQNMSNVLWGKLLLNLNNALNALSGLPLKQQLLDRDWRRVLADSQAETLHVLTHMGIKPSIALPLPPKAMPWILRLPTFLYARIAASSLQIDDEARSSMWEDFAKNRPTEIDDLQGEVVRHARLLGLKTPVLDHIMMQIKKAEKAGQGSPNIDAMTFRSAMA